MRAKRANDPPANDAGDRAARPDPSLSKKRFAQDDKCSQRRRDFLPIWSCSVWGLPCPRHYCRGGALLPHLFTLTPPILVRRLRAARVENEPEWAGRYVFCGTFRRVTAFPRLAKAARRGAPPPSRTLSGTLLCGVRTFLPAHSRNPAGSFSRCSLNRDLTNRRGCQNGRGGRPVRLPTRTLYAMGAYQ